MKETPINKVMLWERPDGVSVSYYFQSFIDKSGLSTDDYIKNHVDKLKRDNPDTYGKYKLIESDVSQIPKDRGNRDKWRLDGAGKLKVDMSVKTMKDKIEEKKSSIVSKLKTVGLTDDELDYLLK